MFNRSNKAIRTAAVSLQDSHFFRSTPCSANPTFVLQDVFRKQFQRAEIYRDQYSFLPIFDVYGIYLTSLECNCSGNRKQRPLLCIMVPVTVVPLKQASRLCMLILGEKAGSLNPWFLHTLGYETLRITPRRQCSLCQEQHGHRSESFALLWCKTGGKQ